MHPCDTDKPLARIAVAVGTSCLCCAFWRGIVIGAALAALILWLKG